jgi:hypothetical protein
MGEVDWEQIAQLHNTVAAAMISTEKLGRDAEGWPDADEIAALAVEAHAVLDRLDDALINYREG